MFRLPKPYLEDRPGWYTTTPSDPLSPVTDAVMDPRIYNTSKIWKSLDTVTLQEAVSAGAKFNEYSFRKFDISKFSQISTEDLLKSITGKPKGVKLKSKVYTPLHAIETDNRSPSVRSVDNEGHNPRDELSRVRKADNRMDHPRDGSINIIEVSSEGYSQNRQQRAVLETEKLAQESKTERRSRYGRLIKERVYSVFSKEITKNTTAFQIVDINESNSSSIQVPTPPFESITVGQAMNEDEKLWTEAILSELQSLEKIGTFTIIKGNPPINRKVISSKLVLRKKLKSDGTLARRKARIVVRGFEQEYGTDYFETFASVIRFNTLRILLAKAAADELEIEALDVETAFLNPKLEEEIFMEDPQFFQLVHPNVNRDTHHLKLNKSLYGLKQAPLAWFNEVKSHFAKIGLRGGDANPNLFLGRNVYVLLYVDDMLIIGTKRAVESVKKDIKNRWKCKLLDPIETFVGLQVERNRVVRSLRIHQSAYTTKLLMRMKMQTCNSKQTPLPPKTILRKTQDGDTWRDLGNDETGLCRQIVGAILCLSNGTRPDISYAAGQLARFMSSPNSHHLEIAKHLLRYLNGTRNLGITYAASEAREIEWLAWTDATWGTEEDMKSFQGYTVIWHNGAVSWCANRQKNTALSSMEAEIMAASEGAKELAWMEKNRD
ncbi:hypothetical protein K3495_g13478 [Podosphaera aphanis]|nr:hypothetical protein K3495_g13478 [Podosphaera aphanis]